MTPLVIVVDLDAIGIDLIRPWLKWYNDKYRDDITVDDIKTYKVEHYTKKTKRVFDFFVDLDNYANCPVLPGAAEGLLALHEDGHDIIIATATAGRTAQIKWDHARSLEGDGELGKNAS